MIDPYFHNFNFEAYEIIRFAQSGSLFSLLMADRYTVNHYEARREQLDDFRQWLLANGISDAKSGM